MEQMVKETIGIFLHFSSKDWNRIWICCYDYKKLQGWSAVVGVDSSWNTSCLLGNINVLKPYKKVWMSHVDGLIFTLIRVALLMEIFNSKPICALALVIGFVAMVFIGVLVMYHKCVKVKKTRVIYTEIMCIDITYMSNALCNRCSIWLSQYWGQWMCKLYIYIYFLKSRH